MKTIKISLFSKGCRVGPKKMAELLAKKLNAAEYKRLYQIVCPERGNSEDRIYALSDAMEAWLVKAGGLKPNEAVGILDE